MSDQRTRTVSLAGLAYTGVVAVGAWLRLARLAWPPLTDTEAIRALAAAAGTPKPSAFWPALPPTDPAYSSLTSLVLQAIGSRDFVVRIVPALAGIAVLFLPWLLRKRLGMGASLLAAGLLAVSPTMLASSRTAGGSSLAVAGAFLALAFVMGRETPGGSTGRNIGAAALPAGLALAASPTVFTGLLGVAIGLGLAQLGAGRMRLAPIRVAGSGRWGQAILLTIGAAVALAVALGAYPLGLAGLGAEIGSWLTGWRLGSAFGLLTLLAALLIYEPLIMVAGVMCAWLGWRRREPFVLGLALGSVGLALAVGVYPGHTPEDLQWLVVPMALLAGGAIGRLIEGLETSESRPTVAALTAVLAVLLAFAYLQLASYARGLSPNMTLDPGLRLWLAGAALALGAFVCILFGLGWSWRMAGQAASLALGVGLFLTTVSMAAGLSFGPSAASATQLWRSSATAPEAASLQATLRGVSQAKTGRMDALPVLVEDSVSPALAWLLRDFPAARQIAGPEQPAVILMRPKAQNPALGADYVGQTVVLGDKWGWEGPIPPGVLAWWVTRQAPTVGENWLLLVRADLASFGELPAQPAPPAAP